MRPDQALRRAHELAEFCIATGQWAEASKLIATQLSQDANPDHEGLREMLETIVEVADDLAAEINLAMLLLDPAAGEVDPGHAFGLLQEAADKIEDPDRVGVDPGLVGIVHGLIADCYIEGDGVREDPSAALHHYLRAAELGNAKAAFAAALAFDTGVLDQPVDKVEAMHFYRIAAAADEPRAMTNLALIYLAEQEAPDEVAITGLLERARELGDERAAVILAELEDDESA